MDKLVLWDFGRIIIECDCGHEMEFTELSGSEECEECNASIEWSVYTDVLETDEQGD